jgi:hypothetical protein
MKQSENSRFPLNPVLAAWPTRPHSPPTKLNTSAINFPFSICCQLFHHILNLWLPDQ